MYQRKAGDFGYVQIPANQYQNPDGSYRYWDELALTPPTGAVYADISLMYQPTSWEYIQFLYLANNGQNAFLANEGINLLNAWLNTGMAEPKVITSAKWGLLQLPRVLPLVHRKT